jgi:phage terminase large subunit
LVRLAEKVEVKDIVEARGLSELFVFNTSSLEIRCKNGNKLSAGGLMSRGELKSLSNTTHYWIEEGNQLDLEHVLMTTLPSNTGRVKTWFISIPRRR